MRLPFYRWFSIKVCHSQLSLPKILREKMWGLFLLLLFFVIFTHRYFALFLSLLHSLLFITLFSYIYIYIRLIYLAQYIRLMLSHHLPNSKIGLIIVIVKIIHLNYWFRRSAYSNSRRYTKDKICWHIEVPHPKYLWLNLYYIWCAYVCVYACCRYIYLAYFWSLEFGCSEMPINLH